MGKPGSGDLAVTRANLQVAGSSAQRMDSTTSGGGRRSGDTDDWSSLRSAPFGSGLLGSAGDDTDPWAWAAKEPVAPVTRDVSGPHVTAVLVAFDAARWLEATLDGRSPAGRAPGGRLRAARSLLRRS